MEVNKEQAEKCRDLGAAALRQGNYPKAAKFLQKSIRLYPLPGVEALYTHAQEKLDKASSSPPPRAAATPRATTASPNAQQGADGRTYTEDQVKIVRTVLSAKEGGRGAHYRVLQIEQSASEAQIKKAYRKLSLKVHPDKNSAPHADEAFKAVGLAYATLSDAQKKTIYDRYGEEDPDNRGGGGARNGMRHGRHGQEMSPEDIFNAFFGGGMPGGGGGPGVHFYSTGFGPGMNFQQRQHRRPQQRQGQQPEQQQGGLGMLMQLLPVLFIMALSFFSQSDDSYGAGSRAMPGENQYFSLTNKVPFTNPMSTKLSKVKEIPYFVSDKFMRTYYRDRYQLGKVETMVERAYENYLVKECSGQQEYKKRLWARGQHETDGSEKARRLKLAREFELSRCDELADLFPNRRK